jgi:hypothetical protein
MKVVYLKLIQQERRSSLGNLTSISYLYDFNGIRSLNNRIPADNESKLVMLLYLLSFLDRWVVTCKRISKC